MPGDHLAREIAAVLDLSWVRAELAPCYLHYVFGLWAERWRRREATGDMVLMRYADDIVVGFEHETPGASGNTCVLG